ncbi:IclR family transcriptional regulator [Zwartia sp.]|uniref:IclR family transcriptional regulator n=1 Tax=Zwartia sp. TaxID=2978004 RepID=UPI002725905E|nr:IclR family transcriptional regulator [Zwartia sp.]MDO9024511.1 IclR family transcriptional regulator [Zwartia sp.]
MKEIKSQSLGTEPRSLLRLFKIFETIAQSQEGAGLTELSTALDAPKSSLLLLLRPLVTHGYLLHQDRKYTLGPQIFQFSSEILSTRSFSRIIRPFLEELAKLSTESIYLTVINREAGVVTYLEGIESRNPVRYVAPVGTTRPLYVSAAGQALLAFQEPAWRDQYLERTRLKSPTSHTVISRTKLRSELIAIRKAGFSISIGSAVAGAAGMAAPIVIGDQPVEYAILISAPAERFEKSIPRFKKMLTEAVARAANSLGRAGGITL